MTVMPSEISSTSYKSIGTRPDPPRRRRQGDRAAPATAPTSSCPACCTARPAQPARPRAHRARSTPRRRRAMPGVKAVVTGADFPDLGPDPARRARTSRHARQRPGARQGALQRPRGRRRRRHRRSQSARQAAAAHRGRLRGAAARDRRRRGDGPRRAAPARRPDHRRRRAGADGQADQRRRRASSSSGATSRRASPRPTSSSSASSRPNGPSGLHRAARLRRARRTPTDRLTIWCARRAPSSCATLRRAARHRRRRKIKVIRRRDRRRLRRQDRRLPRAAGGGAVAEGRPAGEDGDGRATRCSRRPARRRARMTVKIGAKTRRHARRGEAWLAYEAGAFPGSPVGAGAMCVFACYEIPNVLIDGYDVVVNKPKIGGLPRARRADGGLRHRDRGRRARRQARHRPDRAPPEERGRGGHAGRLRAEVTARSASRRCSRPCADHPHYAGAARARTRAAASPAASGSTPA